MVQKYFQVNDSFFKSDHPAVARTKTRPSSPFPTALTPTSIGPDSLPDPTFFPNPYHSPSFSSPEDSLARPPSYNDDIIPMPDPKPEEAVPDAGSSTESPSRYDRLPARLSETSGREYKQKRKMRGCLVY